MSDKDSHKQVCFFFTFSGLWHVIPWWVGDTGAGVVLGSLSWGMGEWGTGNGVEGPAYKTLTAVRRLVPRSGARERCHEEKQRPVSQDWP